MQYTVSLKENRQFRRLYARGKQVANGHLALYVQKNRNKQNQLGITVSGKLGNAVVRNRLRRRLKEIYRTNEALFLPGHTMVVVARGRARGVDYATLRRSFLSLAERAQLLRTEDSP